MPTNDSVERLLDLAAACFDARVVQLAAELGIADLLVDGPKLAEELAGPTQTHAPSLSRLLRALASLGVLEHRPDDRFALAELGTALRREHPNSARAGVLLFGMWWDAWAQFEHSIRTGEPAAARVFGRDVFEHLGNNPALALIFNEGMSSLNASLLPGLVGAYPFAEHHLIVDVAGGHGTLLAAVLASAPGSIGVLYDLSEVIEGAALTFAERGLAARSRCVAGDMFESVPPDGDAYLLKWILHDWDDESCMRILANIRSNMSPSSRLLIIERVLPERVDATADDRRMMMADLRMLVALGGRERTARELRSLLAASDLDLLEIVDTGTSSSIIVARTSDEST